MGNHTGTMLNVVVGGTAGIHLMTRAMKHAGDLVAARHTLCSPLVGLLNAIVYAFYTDKDVWRRCNFTGIKAAVFSR